MLATTVLRAVALTLALSPIAAHAGPASYDDLLALFDDWRAFETPPSRNGAPDYTAATTAARHKRLGALRARLESMEIAPWPVPHQVDWHLVRAEMNGMDFNVRVLRPWARDPAFYVSVWTYQSDTPAHEGPVNHALVELWSYTFPLAPEAERRLTAELETIPPLLEQARANLTGDARDLWLSGIESVRGQARDLGDLAAKTADAGDALQGAVAGALGATRGFVAWLEAQAPNRKGPSGIGRENYSWHLQQVHYVPMRWEDEVTLLHRELDRAWASLAFEEHRNRDLPELVAIADEADYERRVDASVRRYLGFLKDHDILEVRDYMEPALRARTGRFVPRETRNFFWTAVHYEPMTLWTHFYHWWDLALMQARPNESPVRRGPLLYNIFDSRSEGLATGVEEFMLQAGLYDDNPRAREIVYIMLAQRAARGLASLHAHDNTFTMKQARDFQVKWTPRGWMREDLDLLGFEQQLYLRQPGYGTSYVTGKALIERLLRDRRRQRGGDYPLRRFYAELDDAGVIPVSLVRWELTGKDDEIRAIMAAADTPPWAP